MRVVFLGTGDFACPALRRLARCHDVVLTVTQPDRPVGRHAEPVPPPVKREAEALGIPVDQPERINASEAVANLRAARPDVLVVAAYGQLLKPDVFHAAPFGAINIHASLLPAYRGAAPVQWTIIAGEEETGITTFRIDAGMDTGPLLLQRRVPIDGEETAEELERRLADLGAEVISETLDGLLSGSLSEVPQPEAGGALAPKLSRDAGRIDWTQSARRTHDLVRGTVPWPGAWTRLEQERVKIHRTALTRVAVGHVEPGAVGPRDSGQLLIGCGDVLLEILEVQRGGRPRTSGREFLNGLRHGVRFV